MPASGYPRRTPRGVAIGIALALVLLFAPRAASAYTWMVRHGYSGCAPCHLDPSGGSVLTAYGRSVGGLVLTSSYVDDEDEPEEASSLHDFAFGVPLPEPLMLGGDARLLWFADKIEGVKTNKDWFIMQADLQAAVSYKHVLASGSLGYASQGAYAAAITRGDEDNIVSRHHWVGYEFDQETGLIVRAGRMNLPFGIRNVEHTLLVRQRTETTIESHQQHGVAVAWSPGWFRAELMAILGNYQLRPDMYRERGYSGYFEWLPTTKLGLGVSSLITHVDVDDVFLKEAWRQSHGLTVRYATPFEPLVLLGEVDYVLLSSKQEFHRKGVVGYVQADLEPFQGLHLLFTGEFQEVGVYDTPISWGAWFSQMWFFAPHADVRIDNIYQRLADEFGATDSLTLLLQGHFYL